MQDSWNGGPRKMLGQKIKSMRKITCEKSKDCFEKDVMESDLYVFCAYVDKDNLKEAKFDSRKKVIQKLGHL